MTRDHQSLLNLSILHACVKLKCQHLSMYSPTWILLKSQGGCTYTDKCIMRDLCVCVCVCVCVCMQLDPLTVWLPEVVAELPGFAELNLSWAMMVSSSWQCVLLYWSSYPSLRPPGLASISSFLTSEPSTSRTQSVQAMRKIQSIDVKIIRASVKAFRDKCQCQLHNGSSPMQVTGWV